MKKHAQAYTEAANLVLKLSQNTLKQSLERYKDDNRYIKYIEQVNEFLNLSEKSVNNNPDIFKCDDKKTKISIPISILGKNHKNSERDLE